MLANLQPIQDQSQEIPESQESSELERKWAWGSAEATTPLPRGALLENKVCFSGDCYSWDFDEDRTPATELLHRADIKVSSCCLE